MKKINDDFEIHDKYRFELKFDYNFSESKKNSRYEIDTYFFLPNSIDINEDTYPKNDFYNNLQNYIRLDTPKFSLPEVLNASTGPIARLKQSIADLIVTPKQNINRRCAYNIKMFAVIVREAIKTHQERIKKNMQSQNKIEKELNEFLKYGPKISNAFKMLKKEIDKIHYKGDPPVSLLFENVDEFISLLIETSIYEIIYMLQMKRKYLAYRKKMKSIALKELQYRKKQKYETILTKGDNTLFLYRFSMLKKIVSSVLFLSIRRINRAKRIEQIWFGLAAGLAMAISTIITLIAKWKYGAFTSSFFLIIVIAYVLKDRIKDFMKFYLTHSFMHSIYDNEIKIYGPFHKLKIGLLKESVSFIQSNKIEKIILQLRNRDILLDNEELQETILLHRKDVKIYSKRLNKIFHKINAIHDITRINVNPFLLKMDNPYKTIFTFEKEKLKQLKAKRAYHINMVIKLKTDENIIYKRFRLILTRKGIDKIEKIKTKVQNPSKK